MKAALVQLNASDDPVANLPVTAGFVRQAAAQFKLFTQSDPDDALMRAAFEGALGLG